MGRELTQRLESRCDVRVLTTERAPLAVSKHAGWRCDLLSIPQTEVALAGADVAVFLARVSRPPARLVQATAEELETLMADSLARAAPRTSVKRIVLFACESDDFRVPLLQRSGLPLSVLRGGGDDPAGALADLVFSAEPVEQALPPWRAPAQAAAPARPGVLVCSVQRHELPRGWTARDVADGYFTWLVDGLPLVGVERLEQNIVVRASGIPVLMLRHAPGASEPGSAVLAVYDGLLVKRGTTGARLEFRVPLTGGCVYTVLHGFSPSLPWPVYRLTQALAHTSSMRSFGRWLGAQTQRA